MASSNFADMLSQIPGDYLFQRQGYDLAEGFHADLVWTERFRREYGFAYERIRARASDRIDAFCVRIQENRAPSGARG